MVDVEDLTGFAGSLDDVVVSKDYKYMCSDLGARLIKDSIREHDLDGVVVACCSPRMHEHTFRQVVEDGGVNRFNLEIANVREQCSWAHDDPVKATEKAKSLVKGSVAKARLLEPLEKSRIPVTQKALVVGAGIAGIQASLDLADEGFKVFLVEREPSIGGRMAQLDKTFPTLDCSSCILTPKMMDVASHPNIELLAYSEVVDVEGSIGNYKVRIRKKPRFVDVEKCTACNDCVKVCPVDVKDEFNMGQGLRKAIYIPFPQAVPQKYTIDKIGVPPCMDACPAGVNVQGYIALISQRKFNEALELVRESNPFPSVCGRVCSHPCEQECSRKEFDEPLAIRALKRFIADHGVEGRKPKVPRKRREKIAVVGSGPAGLTCSYYLARWGYNVTVFEALPVAGGMLAVGIPSFRLPRDMLKKDIDYIRDWGVEIKTGQALGMDFSIEDLFSMGYKSIFLALGAHREKRLGIPGEELEGVLYCVDFLRKVNLEGNVRVKGKVVVVGGGNAAVDAARTALRCGAEEVSIIYRRTRLEMPADEEEICAAEEEGVKIEYLVSPVKILGRGGKVTEVECIRMELGSPDESGRRRPIPVEGSEFRINVDTFIPAISQTPDLSWISEKERLKKTEWDTLVADPETLETSIPGVFAGGDAVTGPGTIIEAIGHGRKAATSIDRFLRGKDLKRKEKKERVAPVPDRRVERQPRALPEKIPPEKRILDFEEIEQCLSEESAVEEALRCLNCNVCSLCKQCIEVCEADAIDFEQQEEEIEEEVGAIVVTTGFDLMDPTNLYEYGYASSLDVITSLELERLISSSGPTLGEVLRPSDKKKPSSITFILCVGSRDETQNRWCCRIGCMSALKHVYLLREKLGEDVEINICYTDIRSYGKGYEEFYRKIRGMKANFFRGRPSEVRDMKDHLKIEVFDTTTNKLFEIKTDMVVLVPALVPRYDAEEIMRILRISKSEDGFFLEAHPKFRPLDTFTDGIFIAGCCQGPKDIQDTVSQASGVAARAATILSKKELELDPLIATVDEETCSGCGICIAICPYAAVELVEEETTHARVNEALCKGCGACVGACSSGAMQQNGFKDKQLLMMIDETI
jgi:heterodisulfide reductase subunit A